MQEQHTSLIRDPHGLRAPAGDAGFHAYSRRQEGRKVLPRMAFGHVSVLGSYHSCRQLDKDLVQHITLPPQVTHISSSEAQQISVQLFCLFL